MSNMTLKNTEVAAKLINLTPYPISTYDKLSGEIFTLLPKVQELPVEPIEGNKVFYILTRGDVERLKDIDRPLNDIAIIRDVMCGRDNKKVAYFSWANDLKKEVCLYYGYNLYGFSS